MSAGGGVPNAVLKSTRKLTAEQRSEFGKGAARRLRRAHKVPAVLYGHGTDPVHIALDGHATMLALKNSNALLSLDFGGGRSELALPKDIQRDPVRGHIEHVDLLLVRRGEKEVVLRDAQNKEVVLAARNVETLRPSRMSLMPEGQLAGLTAQEAADLLEYLATRK